MAVLRKTDPIDLDIPIDTFQEYLFTNLSIAGFVNATGWNSYHRIYANPKGNGLLPFRYVGEKEYKRVLFDDKFTMTSFFYADAKRVVTNAGMITVEVSLVVQANILKMFTTVPHRADEELKNAFVQISNTYFYAEDFRLIGIEEGINNVYSEFEKEESRLHDMSTKHVFRLKYKVRYTPKCCTDC